MSPVTRDTDDRITCASCERRSRHNGACLSSVQLGTTRSYTPDPDLPRRCEEYLPRPGQRDMRSGRARWRLLPMGADPVEYNRRRS